MSYTRKKEMKNSYQKSVEQMSREVKIATNRVEFLKKLYAEMQEKKSKVGA
jgi:hypothetical protein